MCQSEISLVMLCSQVDMSIHCSILAVIMKTKTTIAYYALYHIIVCLF